MVARLPKVVFTAPVSEMPNDLLDGHVRVNVLRHRLPLTEEQLIVKLKNASGVLCFLSDPVTGRVLESCPRLKAVALHAVGYNNAVVAPPRNEYAIIKTSNNAKKTPPPIRDAKKT